MLIGEKIILEPIEDKHVETLRVWRNSPELRHYFREYRLISQAMQERWYLERGNNTHPEHIYFQILSKTHKNLIGCAGLHYINWQARKAEFGIFLKEERREGKGKEALLLLLKYGFLELNLHKIWAEVYDNNEALAIYKKLGFVEEGILRDNYFKQGSYGNSTIISLLEQEYKEKYLP